MSSIVIVTISNYCFICGGILTPGGTASGIFILSSILILSTNNWNLQSFSPISSLVWCVDILVLKHRSRLESCRCQTDLISSRFRDNTTLWLHTRIQVGTSSDGGRGGGGGGGGSISIVMKGNCTALRGNTSEVYWEKVLLKYIK